MGNKRNTATGTKFDGQASRSKTSQRSVDKGQRAMKTGLGVAITGTAIKGVATGAGLVGLATANVPQAVLGYLGRQFGHGINAAGMGIYNAGQRRVTFANGLDGLVSKSNGNSAALGMRRIQRAMPQQESRLSPAEQSKFAAENKEYGQQHVAAEPADKGTGNKKRGTQNEKNQQAIIAARQAKAAANGGGDK